MGLRGIFDGGGVRKQNGHWQSSEPGKIVLTGNIKLQTANVTDLWSWYSYVMTPGYSQDINFEAGHKYHVEYKVRIDAFPFVGSAKRSLDLWIHDTLMPAYVGSSGQYRFVDGYGTRLQHSNFHTPVLQNSSDIEIYSTYSSYTNPTLVAKITNLHLDTKWQYNTQYMGYYLATCGDPDISDPSVNINAGVGEYIVLSYDFEYIQNYHSSFNLGAAYTKIAYRVDFMERAIPDPPEFIGQFDRSVTEIV